MKSIAPHYSIGTAPARSRASKDNLLNPAPNFYNPRDSKKGAPNWSIGTGSRAPLSKSNQNPGPGLYNPTQKQKGPSYPMGIKSSSKTELSGPGPGHYSPMSTLTKEGAPSHLIGTASKEEGATSAKKKRDGPGPGNYSFMRPNSTGPAHVFGSGLRGDPRKDKTPGPGQYKVPCHVADVPRYVIPNPNEEFKFV